MAAFTDIDETQPAGTDRVSILDDKIRETRSWAKATIKLISTFPSYVTTKIASWTTSTRPATSGKTGAIGYNSDTDLLEYFDSSGVISISKTYIANAVAALKTTIESQLATIRSSISSINATLTGEIKMWGGQNVPSGYLLCNGQAVSRTTYAALFSVIGTIYGSGNGSTTFNLPNMTDAIILNNTSVTVSANGYMYFSHGGEVRALSQSENGSYHAQHLSCWFSNNGSFSDIAYSSGLKATLNSGKGTNYFRYIIKY